MAIDGRSILPLLNDTDREHLRNALIREQRAKTEVGLEQVLLGSEAAQLHLLNALSIVADAWQGEALALALTRIHQVRLAMWGAQGSLNQYRAFNTKER